MSNCSCKCVKAAERKSWLKSVYGTAELMCVGLITDEETEEIRDLFNKILKRYECHGSCINLIEKKWSYERKLNS